MTGHSVSGRQYGGFLTTIFDEWVRRDVGKVFVQTFDAALAAWAGRAPGVCILDEVCGTALVLEHNGEPGLNYLCPGYAEFRSKLVKVGRNDPCPCGSGLKFKHCHGRFQ